MIVAVLGLAELVEEEDDGLQAQDQHDPPDEAGRVKRVLVRRAGGCERCGAGASWEGKGGCNETRLADKGWGWG